MEKPSFKNNLQSIFDYVSFVIKYQKVLVSSLLLIDLGILIAGVILLLTGTKSQKIMALVWGSLNILYSVYKIIQNLSRYRINDAVEVEKINGVPLNDRTLDFKHILPSKYACTLGYKTITLNGDTIITSDEINNVLWNAEKDWSIVADQIHPNIVDGVIKDNRKFCLRLLTRRFTRSIGRK